MSNIANPLTFEVSQEILAFLIDRQSRRLSPSTIEFYQQELDLFQKWLAEQGIFKMGQLSSRGLREYFLFLGKRRNAGGLHCTFRTLRCFLRWWERETEPAWTNPITKLDPPRVNREVLPGVELPDVKAMLFTCGKDFSGVRDRAILLALVDTGLRKAEFTALNVDDLNVSTGAIFVRHGKGDKPRMVYAGARTRLELIRYLRLRPRIEGEDQPLWVSVQGARLKGSGLRQVVRRRALQAGIPVPGLHDFRRAFALACLRNGADIFSVQQLMGHSSLVVLSRYLKLAQSDIEAAHKKASPVDNL